jgi:hypothetical protein
MHVSANIIGFPVQLTPSAPAAAQLKAPAEIVHFPASIDHASSEAHEHGRIFAAHRIAARIADQLEQTANL